MKKIKKLLKKKDGSSKFTKKLSLPLIFIFAFAALGVYALTRSQAAAGNDLIVTNVTMNPANPSAGQTVTLTATIQNQGATPTTAGTVVGVGFAVDGTTIAWNRSTTSSLAAGASITLSANAGTTGSTWTATAGPHVVTATADDTNVIPDEVSEANNSKTLNITVGNTGSLYITPATTSININNNFTVELRLNPGIVVEGVEATITYDATKLQFVSMDPTGSLFDTELVAQSGTSGTINITRVGMAATVSNDTLVSRLTFRSLAGSGSTTIQTAGNATKDGVYTNPTRVNATVNFATPDTTAPAVSITVPTAGTTIFKTTTITANASDAVGVSRVEFYVDGQLRGQPDTTAPYSISLDTSTLSNGNRSLTARAFDAAGNVGTSPPVTAFVKNWVEDINEDSFVNLLDFSLLRMVYGQSGPNLGRADINRDGTVNLPDFGMLRRVYGQ